MKDKRFEIVETEGTAKGIFVIVDRKTGVNYLATKFGAAGSTKTASRLLLKTETPQGMSRHRTGFCD